ncbi:C6 zinc finger domain protein [Moelleriella libera RCEF 2490]|uniref:C6 zinc finger domain protein n=1 Tax=Moelleriella libera RCEF 2490 TaxID=1081109 RepID=A0A166U522_9HYPO|nr:C6 zinc finger domain protein [Moelleriella libera RCEF 2490]
MDASPIVARGGASLSPTSPTSSRHGNAGPKRKRSGPVTHESSPGSALDDDQVDHGDPDKKRQPGVKRACNECRQQKVRYVGLFSLLDAPLNSGSADASCDATLYKIPSRAVPVAIA